MSDILSVCMQDILYGRQPDLREQQIMEPQHMTGRTVGMFAIG